MVAGVVSQIMAARSPNVFRLEGALPAASVYPPTLFMHMPRDGRTAAMVEENLELLHSSGVRAEQYLLEPLPVNKSFFSDRIEEVPPSLSERLHHVLQDGGFLDHEHYLAYDPR